jgi:DNA invertase Pin-like site-specific DNA recombinase
LSVSSGCLTWYGEEHTLAHGYELVGWYCDAAVRGADPVAYRPGFGAMLAAITGDGVRTILIESPDRFARDLAVQLAGHDRLKRLGVALVPTSAPDHFIEDTPTAILVRQVLGAIAQFDKATLVVKLKAARDRKRARTGKCGGRPSHIEARPQVVALARQSRRKRPKGGQRSLREIAAKLERAGHLNERGVRYSATSVQHMLAQRT